MSGLRQTRLPVASLVACALLGLGGCGQNGALYLPDPVPQAVPAAPAAAAPATVAPTAVAPTAEEPTRGKAPRLPDPAKSQ